MGEQERQVNNLLLPKEVIGKEEQTEVERLLD